MSFYDLLSMPMSELLEFLNGQPDFIGEAVAKAAYQELARGLYHAE
ncbi:hypothetical protein O1D07_003342 [Vibrio cholerae]|jgi:hypothetical protein|nr:hypothetical protein [Vibrio cholerae]